MSRVGIFFVAVPSSILGAKKERGKKEESSCPFLPRGTQIVLAEIGEIVLARFG